MSTRPGRGSREVLSHQVISRWNPGPDVRKKLVFEPFQTDSPNPWMSPHHRLLPRDSSSTSAPFGTFCSTRDHADG